MQYMYIFKWQKLKNYTKFYYLREMGFSTIYGSQYTYPLVYYPPVLFVYTVSTQFRQSHSKKAANMSLCNHNMVSGLYVC